MIPAEVGLVPQTVSPARLQQANAFQGLTRSGVRVLGPALGGRSSSRAAPESPSPSTLPASSFAPQSWGGSGSRAARGEAAQVPHRPPRGLGGVLVADVALGLRRPLRDRQPAQRVDGARARNRGGAISAAPVPGRRSSPSAGSAQWSERCSRSAFVRRGRSWPASWPRCRSPVRSLALALGAPLWVLAAASFVGGPGLGVHLTLWFTVFQQQVPERAQSRVGSYDTLGSFVLVPLGLRSSGLWSRCWGKRDAVARRSRSCWRPGRRSSHCRRSGRSAAASPNRSSTAGSLR